MKILRSVIVASFFFTYVLGDLVTAFAASEIKQQVVLFAVKAQGVSDVALKTLQNAFSNELASVKDIRIIDINELNIELTNGNKKKILQDASEDEIIQLSRDAGVRWIVAGELGRLGAMHLLSLKILDVASTSNKPVFTKDEDEPGSIENLCNTVVKETSKELVSRVKPKSHKGLYIILSIAGVAGIVYLIIKLLDDDHPRIPLPGPPTGPPTR